MTKKLLKKMLMKKILKLDIPIVLMPLDSSESDSSEECYDTNKSKSINNPGDEPGNMMHNKYILVYNTEVDEMDKTDKLNKMTGFKAKHKFNNVFKGCAATVNKGLMSQLLEDPDILIIEKDSIMYENGYSKEEINTENEQKQQGYWHQTMTNTTQTIMDNFSTIHCYILDTGILPNHTEFNTGQVVMAYNAINKTNRAQDDNGHGTAVASVIGGKTVGVANKTMLHSIKVLSSTGSGYTSDIIAGLNWVLTNRRGPCLINMSLGGAFSTSLNTAVQNCLNNGIQVVCATGNSGVDASNTSPANTSGVIAVSAHDTSKTKPSWSNFGPVVSTFAPGASIRAAWGDSTSSYFMVNGTSFSCPITTGILVRYLKEYPNSRPSDIRSFMNRCNIENEITNTGSENTPNLRIMWNPAKLLPC